MATEYEDSSMILMEEISRQNRIIEDENRALREELRRRDEANAKAMADLKTESPRTTKVKKEHFVKDMEAREQL